MILVCDDDPIAFEKPPTAAFRYDADAARKNKDPVILPSRDFGERTAGEQDSGGIVSKCIASIGRTRSCWQCPLSTRSGHNRPIADISKGAIVNCMARCLWLLLLLSGCATAPLRPALEKLEPWTTSLRDRQPEDAFAAVYKRGRHRLVFVAAQHANREDSLTFRLIRDAYAIFQFDTVIAEGFATSRGVNPPSIFKYAAESGPKADGFVEGGETVPTTLGARHENAKLWGGEPDDLDIKASVLAEGLSDADLLGFYVLRNVPQ